jgi:hypothetical protein
MGGHPYAGLLATLGWPISGGLQTLFSYELVIIQFFHRIKTFQTLVPSSSTFRLSTVNHNDKIRKNDKNDTKSPETAICIKL